METLKGTEVNVLILKTHEAASMLKLSRFGFGRCLGGRLPGKLGLTIYHLELHDVGKQLNRVSLLPEVWQNWHGKEPGHSANPCGSPSRCY